MAESEENKPKPNFVVPMNFEISDRPLEQIEKATKAGFQIVKDVYGRIKVIGRTIVKGDKKEDLNVSE